MAALVHVLSRTYLRSIRFLSRGTNTIRKRGDYTTVLKGKFENLQFGEKFYLCYLRVKLKNFHV